MLHSEKRLIKKVKKGGQQAFKELYHFYANYALRTAYAITRNNNHSSDIVQETFIRVFRNIDSFDMSKPFKPWFYQILLNECRRYMAKQNKQATPIKSEQLLELLHQKKEIVEQYDDLKGALMQLSDMHRTALTLKYLNDFTEKEIAQLLDLNVNTVKSRLFKGRQKLKAILGGGNNDRK